MGGGHCVVVDAVIVAVVAVAIVDVVDGWWCLW